MSASGIVFQIQRWSVNDGPGIRSTVFLKGCPLRCALCANPESWNAAPELMFFHERCTGCGNCVATCPQGAIAMQDGKAFTDKAKCNVCNKCVVVCPAQARQITGACMTVDTVMQAIGRDMIFYRQSGGGVTFSGGCPFAQPEFLRRLVHACNSRGIHAMVESCGFFVWENVSDIITMLDGLFVDIKHMDAAMHKRFTGVDNATILANIRRISAVNPNTIIRVPLVAGVNDSIDNITAMCAFLRDETAVAGVELLLYHDFGSSKYQAVDAEVPQFTAPSAEHLQVLQDIVTAHGLKLFDFK